MHRHGYKGRKFGRETDQRRALIKGLATSLILHGSIETTLPKAKEIVPHVEVLITKAKKGGLHNRRQVISALATLEAANKLVDEIAPKLTGRTSGHLRVVRTTMRVGDNAQLARVSFVDDIAGNVVAPKAVSTTKAVKEQAAPQEDKPKTARAPKKMVAQDQHLANKPTVSVRKSGAR